MSLLSLFLSKIYIRPFGKENQSAFIRYIQHVRRRSRLFFFMSMRTYTQTTLYPYQRVSASSYGAFFSLPSRKEIQIINISYKGKNSSHPYRHLIPTLLKYICWRVCFTVFRKKSCIQICFAKSGVIRSCFNSIFTEVIA